MRLLVLILLASATTACTQYGDTSQLAYFNLDSLLNKQIATLRAQQADLEKAGLVNGALETKQLPFDTALWANELDIFRFVDINKPATVNAYDITQTATQTIYQLKPQEKQQGVIMHRITYDQAKNLQTFEAFFKEENSLYESERNYTIKFAADGLLQSYQLMGRQKVAFGEWVSYEVEGKVIK